MISEWFLIGSLIGIFFCTIFNVISRNSEFAPLISFLLSILMTVIAWGVLSIF